MKKPLKILLIVAGIIYGIYVIIGLTGVFKIYDMPSSANDPGIETNSKIFVSNLSDYQNGDFICYRYEDEILGKQIRVHRLLGKSSDIIAIKNGLFFLNGKNFDQNIELKHFYLIEKSEYQKLLASEKVAKEEMAYPISDNVILITLSDKIAKENGLSYLIKIEPENSADKLIKSVFKKDWNADNFGPLIIPKGKCFVIGDNRHNSQDSRYIGLIDESDIVGTVIKK